MICKFCGGLVTWRGPLSALTHSECESCGGKNCQVLEHEEPEEDDEEDGSPFTASNLFGERD